MPRPSVQGTATFAPVANTAGTSSPLVINTPAGAVSPESLWAALICQTTTAADFGMPDGTWTRKGLAAVNDANVRVTGIFAKQLDAAPAASYSFVTPAATARIGGVMCRVQDWAGDVVTPVGYGGRAGSVVTTTSHNVPANRPSLRLEFFHVVGTSGNALTVASPPPGMTLVGSVITGLNSGSRDAGYLYAENVDEGVAPARSATFNGTLAAGTSNGIILLGDPDAPVRTYPAPFHMVGAVKHYGRFRKAT